MPIDDGGQAIRNAILTFEQYQSLCVHTAIYPHRGEIGGLVYLALGLCGEAGEVAEKVKKVVRDADGDLNEETRQSLIKELGDVCWYLSEISTHLHVSMGEVASGNVAKLSDRIARGVLGGSGDDR